MGIKYDFSSLEPEAQKEIQQMIEDGVDEETINQTILTYSLGGWY